MLFWDNGDPVRLENTKFCWNRSKDLVSFLNSNGIPSKCFLFDFSVNKNIDDSIHIPLNEQYYQRSKKINFALNHTENDTDVFAIIDSDCYFHKSYYNEFKEDVVVSHEQNAVFTYQLIDIALEKRYQFIDFNLNNEKFEDIESNVLNGNFIKYKRHTVTLKPKVCRLFGCSVCTKNTLANTTYHRCCVFK